MILVTGGAGFIGSHLVESLVRDGHEVVILDEFNDYYPVVFKRQNVGSLTAHPNVRIEEGDIADESTVERIFSSYPLTQVVHLAARAGVRPSIVDPLLYEHVNIRGTMVLLEAMRKHGVKDFYFASSSSVYGNQKKVPFSETDPVDNPISPYAASKKTCELMAYTYSHLFGINSVGFRFFTVYGERGRPDMAPYLFTERILKGQPIKKFGDGSTRRDYTYVGDIVSGIRSALSKQFLYEIFNLGNRQTVSLNELIATIENECKKKAVIEQHDLQPGDVSVTFADISKAEKLLGYQPTTSIQEGMARFVSWYQSSRLN